MKKFLTHLLFLVTGLSTFGSPSTQNIEREYTYLPMLEVGKTWTYHFIFAFDYDDPLGVITETAVADTVIDGRKGMIFRIEREIGDRVHIIPPEPDLEYKVRAFEDDRVITYRKEDGSFWSAMDFNAKTGDTFLVDAPNWEKELGNISDKTVTDERYLDIRGTKRRVLQINNGWDYWIEGIGAYDLGYIPCNNIVTSIMLHLMEVSKDGEILYQRGDFNWTSGVESITASSPEAPLSGTIYDLHGRKVTNPVPGTIYVRDGRKFLVR